MELTIDQVLVTVTGVVAIFLSQSSSPRARRLACIFGLLGQPFWFYATWKAGQIGFFILCFFYTAAWARGVYTNWILPRRLLATQGEAISVKVGGSSLYEGQPVVLDDEGRAWPYPSK